MLSILVLKQTEVVATDDIYGIGTTPGGLDIDDLTAGGIILVASSGQLLDRTADGGDIDDEGLDVAGRTVRFVANTPNGLIHGIDINPRDFDVVFVNHSSFTPTAAIGNLVVAAPADLTPFVGQYATVTITDVDAPEYQIDRMKLYTVELDETNVTDIDNVMTDLETEINADADAIVTAVYTEGTNTLTLTHKETGKAFNAVAGDVIRDSVFTMTTPPVDIHTGTDVEEAHTKVASWLGYNPADKANALYDLLPVAEAGVDYDLFVIHTTLNQGPDHSVNFPKTQIIAVPEGCTTLTADILAILEYLGGDAAAVWGTCP